VPAAAYQLIDGRLRLRGATGEVWEASFALDAPVVVRDGAETAVTVGAPFDVRPRVDGVARPGAGVCIGTEICGAGGERYENIAPLRQRMLPAIRIVDAAGVEVLSRQMEYG
jgi:hypothetical protein